MSAEDEGVAAWVGFSGLLEQLIVSLDSCGNVLCWYLVDLLWSG